jgi:hypothetical protein
MITRTATACIAVLLLVACDDADQATKSICKNLSQADCTAKSECRWSTGKEKCKPKKTDERPSSEPEPAPAPAPETTPPQ